MKVLSLSDNVFDVYRNLHVAYPGGNAVNVAVNASKLKYDSYYYGNIASDSFGIYMKNVLNTYGVHILDCNYPDDSSTKLCIEDVIDGERQFIKVDLQDNWAGIPNLDIDVTSYDVLFSSCNSKIENLFYKLDNNHSIISYDFGEKDKYRTKEYFNKIIPYIDFAQFSFNEATIEDIKMLISMMDKEIPVLVTRGGKNPILYVDHQFMEGSLNYVKPLDTMGAGDAYTCCLVTSLVEQGWKKNETLKKEWIENAFEKAAKFSSEICMIPGGISFEYKPKQLDAIIFDMDGVLVDSEKHWMRIYDLLFQQYGKVFTKEIYNEIYGSFEKVQILMIQREFGLSFDDAKKLIYTFFKDYPIDYSKFLMPYVKELISYLKDQGIKLAIASSSTREDIEKMIRQCDLKDAFDLIVSGFDFKESKPDPEIYNYTVDKLQVKKENALVIEDSIYGVLAGLRANIDVLVLKHDEFEVNIDDVLKFDSFKTIKEYIEKCIIGGKL